MLTYNTSYSFSYPSGQPPTPTKTPTSATFSPNAFQTPKAESSFYDPRVTWNTADPYATSPNLLKTPQQSSFSTPTTKRSSSTSTLKRPLSGQDLEAEIASHVHHPSQHPSLSLPPVEPSRQLSSSPNPGSAKRSCWAKDQLSKSPGLGLDLDTGVAMHSASSMQTPPPTSTSASRRKAQQVQVAKLVQQSAANGRRTSTPGFPKPNDTEPPKSQVEASPQQFQSLQFSPDVFDFPLTGPATAPIYPQHKLFWDPQRNDEMNLDFSTDLIDPFSTGHDRTLQPYVSAHHQPSVPQASILPSFLDSSPNTNSSKEYSLTASTVAHGQISTVSRAISLSKSSSRNKLSGHVVDPSLLFSSPGRSSEPLTGSISSMAALDPETLQPYAYQIQEAKREQALGASSRVKKKRGLENDSPAVKAALEALREDGPVRPSVRRSMTDSAITRSSASTQRIDHELSEGAGESQIERCPSPVKQHQRSISRKSHPFKRRTAVTLTIDPNGRARTETKVIVQDREKSSEDGRMDIDHVSGGSDSDSSSDDPELAVTTSHGPSFDFDARPAKQPKLGRFFTNSRSHSQKSSYSSINTASIYSDNLSKPSYVKSKATSNVVSRTSRTQKSTLSTTFIDQEPLSDSESIMNASDGKAQSELKKVLETRAKEKRTQDQYAGHSLRPRPSNMKNGFGTDMMPPDRQLPNKYSDISPTTITDPDLATPSTDGGSQSTENTRCICHVQENDGQMILW